MKKLLCESLEEYRNIQYTFVLERYENLNLNDFKHLDEDWKSAISKGLIAVTLLGSLYGTPVQAQEKNPEKYKEKTEKMYIQYTEQREKADKPVASYEEWLKWYTTGQNLSPEEVDQMVKKAQETNEIPIKVKPKNLSYDIYKSDIYPYEQWSYEEWVARQISKRGIKNVINVDSTKFGSTDVLLSKIKLTLDNEDTQSVVLVSKNDITPGNYLIKAKKQILTGAGLQVAGGVLGYLIVNSTKNINPADYPKQSNVSGPGFGDEEGIISYESAVKSRTNLGIATGIILGVVGAGFEISGIIHIGNAGVSLNANGIGVTIPIGK